MFPYQLTEVYWPAPSKQVNSEYGMRYHPIEKKDKMHWGIDIAPLTYNTAVDPIRAMHNGVVSSVGYFENGYGKVVFINHVGANAVKTVNIKSVYAHLHTVSVSAGQAVNGYTQIGTMGTTGASTGVHLHFETQTCPTTACNSSQSDAVNPRIWYTNDQPVRIKDPITEELHKSYETSEYGELSEDNPNYYTMEELKEMTPEELIEIGYPDLMSFNNCEEKRKISKGISSFLKHYLYILNFIEYRSFQDTLDQHVIGTNQDCG